MKLSRTGHWIERLSLGLVGVTAVLAAGVALCGGDRVPGTQASLREALAAYQARHWDAAYTRFADLADAGDPAAARVAAMMAHQGPQLFGRRFGADPGRLERWEATMRGRTPRAGERVAVNDFNTPDPTPGSAVLTTAVRSADTR